MIALRREGHFIAGYRVSMQMTSRRHHFNLKAINYCIPGLLSNCGAGKKWSEHKVCRFAIKSSFANKCMYYNGSMGGHCDCLDAQKDAMTIVGDWFFMLAWIIERADTHWIAQNSYDRKWTETRDLESIDGSRPEITFDFWWVTATEESLDAKRIDVEYFWLISTARCFLWRLSPSCFCVSSMRC